MSEGEYTVPTGLTATYGDKLSSVTLPDNWSWKDAGDTSVGNAGENSFTAVYEVSNYNAVEKTLTITVAKKDLSEGEYTVPTGLTATYGDNLSSVALPENWSWNDGNQLVGNAGTNKFWATFNYDNTGNYNPVSLELSVEVSKADPSYTLLADLKVTYGENISSVEFPTAVNGKWSWAEGVDTASAITSDAGTELKYNAVFTPEDTANYNIITTEVNVTVTQAKSIVNPVYDKSVDYTQFGALPALALKGGDTPGTIKWSTSNGGYLNYGRNVLVWEFTPDNRTNYTTETGRIIIDAKAISTTKVSDISDGDIARSFTYSDANYYYDPDSIMIMPLPKETPSFVNEYGLVFKKVDEYGELLSGATIQLQMKENGEFVAVSDEIWNWTSKPSSYTIPIDKLTTGVVYRFYEAASPSKEYEKAEPIYFMKTDDTTVKYAMSEEELDNGTELDLAAGNSVIEMVDKGVYGAAITLNKVNEVNKLIDGAKFKLYAVGTNEDVLVYPLNDGKDFEFENGSVDLYKWFNSAGAGTYNSEYVKNGYLKPGGYYLYEVETPSTAYKKPEAPLYFTVEETVDANGDVSYVVTNEKIPMPYETYVTAFSGTLSGGQQQNDSNTYSNISALEVDFTFVPNDAVPDMNTVITDAKLNVQGDNGWLDGMSAWTSLFINTSLGSYKVSDLGDNNYTIRYEFNEPVYIDGSKNLQYQSNDTSVTVKEIRMCTLVYPPENKYTIDSITLSAPEAVQIEVEPKSDNEKQQWYVYYEEQCMDGGEGDPQISGITQIKVKSTAELKIYVAGMDAQYGTYSDGVMAFTFDSPIDTNKIEFQPKDGWNSYEIRGVEIETSSGTIYTTDSTVVEASNSEVKPDLSISNIKVYYLDGSSETINSEITASETANEDGSYSFDISSPEGINEDVIGMEITFTGSGTGKVNIGNAWTIGAAKAGKYTLGVTDYNPPESDDTDTSNLVSVTDSTITLKNEYLGEETNITVNKIWAGDSDFTEYRTPITVKLYRSIYPTGKDSAGNDSLVYVGDLQNSESSYYDKTFPSADLIAPEVTLKDSNSWKHTWSSLPSMYEKAFVGGELDYENSKRYYYFVKETTELSKYETAYPSQGAVSGEYPITNTLKTMNLVVDKDWNDYEKGVNPPESIEVKLQMKDGESWNDVEGKTLTLKKENGWRGEFTDLPEDETYRAVEIEVPTGWIQYENSESNDKDTALTIQNNLDVGKLALEKIWNDENSTTSRPGEVKLNLYRSIIQLTDTEEYGSVEVPSDKKYTELTEDYARLLQYSLYFYDAQMCGDEVTEKSVLSWRNDCAVDYSTDNIEGGFHDAGDHLMFGLPQGFTASSLGWSYYEYKDTFDMLGLTDHYKVIMQHFCDFFVKSAQLDSDGKVTNFLYQKGAYSEHDTWGPPENRDYHTNQEWWTEDKASDIAANYAAALAQYVINFGDPGNYLKYAEALYEYSTRTNAVATDTVVTNNAGEDVKGYRSVDYKDEQAWAAAWLYLATDKKVENYKTQCKSLLDSLGNSAENRDKRGYFWGNEELAAACVYNAYIADENAQDWSMVTNYLNTYVTPSSDEYIILDGWASARHNTLLQSIALAYDKHTGNNTYKSWAQGQMDYILGANPYNTCFVVGFADNSATSPHHRAASTLVGWDAFNGNPSYSTISGSHVLLGALVGGTHQSDSGILSYKDSCKEVEGNECALDYNAGLVGAAAALYSVYGTGLTVNQEIMKQDGIELKSTTYEYQYENNAVTASADDEEQSIDLSNVSLSLDDGVSVKAREVQYPAYTSFGAIEVNKEIVFDTPYKNVTKVEIDFTAVATPYNTANFQVSVGFDQQASPVVTGTGNSGTVIIKPETWTGNTAKSIKITNTWGLASGTIDEIRFYYETEGPSITPESKTAKVGETFELTVTGITNTINWTSSDETVAEVDENGNVTIKAMPESGDTVRITATDSTDSSLTAYIDITIEAMTITADLQSPVIGDNVTISSNYEGFEITEGTGYKFDGTTIIPTATGDITVNAKCGNATASTTINVSALAITGGQDTMSSGDTAEYGVNGQMDNHEFTWISSDPEVLSIDENGKATALKSGTVTITVTKDKEYIATKEVTIEKGAFRIESQYSSIHAGDSSEITLFNDDGGTVTYSSSDKSVAAVENDKIVGKGVGTATITVTLNNEETGTVEISVEPEPTITAAENINLIGTGDTLQLTASNILGTAEWSSDDTDILEVSDSGLVTAKGVGEATINVKDSRCEHTATYKIKVQLNVATVTLPHNAESVTQITLLPDKNWQDELEMLPKYDEYGNKYYYYIVELDSSGAEIDDLTDRIQGNNALYAPTLYTNNAVFLDGNDTISVTNDIAETTEGQMPSTGGEGTRTYYIYGIIMMLCGIAGFTVLKLRKGRRS